MQSIRLSHDNKPQDKIILISSKDINSYNLISYTEHEIFVWSINKDSYNLVRKEKIPENVKILQILYFCGEICFFVEFSGKFYLKIRNNLFLTDFGHFSSFENNFRVEKNNFKIEKKFFEESFEIKTAEKILNFISKNFLINLSENKIIFYGFSGKNLVKKEVKVEEKLGFCLKMLKHLNFFYFCFENGKILRKKFDDFIKNFNLENSDVIFENNNSICELLINKDGVMFVGVTNSIIIVDNERNIVIQTNCSPSSFYFSDDIFFANFKDSCISIVYKKNEIEYEIEDFKYIEGFKLKGNDFERLYE